MPMKSSLRRLVLLTWIILITSLPAYAYIDPNAQGLIAQSLTPLLVVGATVCMFFRDKAMAAIGWLNRCLRRNDAAE